MSLQFGDVDFVLGNLLFPVGSSVTIASITAYFLLALRAFPLLSLLRLVLRTLRGFLLAFRPMRRAETNNARTFTGTGIVESFRRVA